MILDSLNLNHLRVFECVFRTRNMTSAAQELHLTQSGVSQHIRSLEEALGVKLFDRIHRTLIPTSSAEPLFEECRNAFTDLETVLSTLKGKEVQLSGTVNIGMPLEFGNNLILPLLSEYSKVHAKIRFSIRYGFANQMEEALLKGELDFAFVDDLRMDSRISTQRVYDEILLLCAAQELLESRGSSRETKRFFESLEYVDYQAGEPFLKMWFRHHFGPEKFHLNVRTFIMSVQAVAHLVVHGRAVGVLPSHLTEKLEKEGHHLHFFKGSGKPLCNQIRIAFLGDKTRSPAASAASEWLLSALCN